MIRLLLFFLPFFLYAGSCYSILTQTGLFTPVYPYNFKDNPNFRPVICQLLEERIIWDTNLSYVGCYRTYKEADYALHHLKFNFKTPKIVKHKITLKDQYVIFPNNSFVKKKNINKILYKYTPYKIMSLFPKKFYGDGIDFKNIEKLVFMPTVNMYEFYKFFKKHHLSRKVLILYNGVYSLEYLYKKINNPKIIEKISKNKYILKIPVYISPTATLVINNKTVLLETTPKPIFIMYHGKIYAKNSKFITWNLKTNSFDKREFIPERELLLIGLQKPRPYFIGLSGSKTYFVNNVFKGLGFHSTSATFGIALLHFPKNLIINKPGLFVFLNERKLPEGVYVGNTMYKNMMGFYCSEAENAVLIGNLMYDNKIYNIDPHDYSEGLIIARNITTRAEHAHGIVISRQVDHTMIAQNMTFNNHSAGIMLDRLSNHNLIYDNFAFLNGYMGISIQESDDVLIEKNKLIGNLIDGVMIRNSLRNTVKNNLIMYSGKNGVEVLTKDLSHLVYRDFARDPYHKATAAVVKNNKIINSIFYNVTVKNNGAILLKNNYLKNKYYPNFGGDLNIFTAKIYKNHGNFKLYGIGNPFRAKSVDLIKMKPSVAKEALKIFIDASCNNDFVSNTVARIYFGKFRDYVMAQKEYIRGISLLYKSDMFSYGFFKFLYAKNKNDYITAASYLAESLIFGNTLARIQIAQLKYVLPISEDDINKAFKMAIDRLKKYKVVDDPYNVACKMTSRKKAKIESALKSFEFKFKLSKAKSYYEYCLMAEKNHNTFTPEVIRKIKYIFAKANIPKEVYYRKLLKENEILKDSPGCKLVAIRVKRIHQSLAEYFKTNKKEILRLVDPYIDEYLKKINKFRIKKVTKKEIYKLMERE